MGRITLSAFLCDRCGHIWLPRDWDGKKPETLEDFKSKVCPKCKSPYWDTPRKQPKA